MMKKLLILLAAIAALCTAGAETLKTGQPADATGAGVQYTIHTPSVSTVRRCLGTIADAAGELVSGFSVEQTAAEPDTAGVVYQICIGEGPE